MESEDSKSRGVADASVEVCRSRALRAMDKVRHCKVS